MIKWTVKSKMAACEPNTASRHIESHNCFAKFFPVSRKLCMLGLKLIQFLELFRVFLFALLGFSYARDLEENVLVTLFFGVVVSH